MNVNRNISNQPAFNATMQANFSNRDNIRTVTEEKFPNVNK